MAANHPRTRAIANTIKNVLNKEVERALRDSNGYRQQYLRGEINQGFLRQQAGLDTFRQKLQEQLDRAERNIEDRRNDYQQLLAQRTTVQGRNATEALLAETRATKQWARIERELAGKPKQQVMERIRDLITTAATQQDQATLAGIVSEAPSFLASIGITDPANLVEAIVRAHEPDIAEAHRAIGEAEQLATIIRLNTRFLSEGYERALTANTLVNKPQDLHNYELLVDPDILGTNTTDPDTALRDIFEAELRTETEPDNTQFGQVEQTELAPAN